MPRIKQDRKETPYGARSMGKIESVIEMLRQREGLYKEALKEIEIRLIAHHDEIQRVMVRQNDEICFIMQRCHEQIEQARRDFQDASESE